MDLERAFPLQTIRRIRCVALLFLLAAIPATVRPAETGKSYALLIGVGAYEQWPTLINPITDVRALAAELRARYGFRPEVLENPAREDVLAKLRRYFQIDYGPHDQLVIVFAGHGTYDEVSRIGYLVASDSEDRQRDPNFVSLVNYPWLLTLIDNVDCPNVLLVVDALTPLFPLQPLTAAPYALFAKRAGNAADANTLDGMDSLSFLTAEADPTVQADVKDGVGWNELSGVPAGFADGVDDVGDGVPVGTVVAFAGATPPSGWLLCDGSEVSRTTYAELFAVLAGTWGIGDGLTTFNLPDLRGRAAVGSGSGPGLTTRTVGDLGGEETHLLTVDEMPSHIHKIGYSVGDDYGPGQGVRYLGGSNPTKNTLATGGDQPHNNMPPFAVFNYIIKH